MDGLNLAKELRVFNKSYPTKTPPAEGETPVRIKKYLHKYTIQTLNIKYKIQIQNTKCKI